MEQKTQITAIDGKQELVITREFDLPIHLLFKAYTEPELVAQWMGTNVIKLECKKHGSYQFVTTDPKGNKHCFNGVIHDYLLDQRIIRTFEMENTSFPVQLEFLDFERLTSNTSKLTIKIIYKSAYDRDETLKLPFAIGINLAHNKLQEIVENLSTSS